MEENKFSIGKKYEDWRKAREGIQLVLNNKRDEADAIFANRNTSIQLATGHAFTVFMNAVMSFEEDSLKEAAEVLKELENRCATNLGWFKSMKSRVFGSEKNPYEVIEQQIILADCQVCQAVISMINQDSTTSFVKGGWILKKAWSLYLSTYNNLVADYKKCFGSEITFLPRKTIVESKSLDLRPSMSTFHKGTSSYTLGGTPLSAASIFSKKSKMSADMLSTAPMAGSMDSSLEDHQYSIPDVTVSAAPIPKSTLPEIVNRLTRAVCFGYGLFHLCISLLPPTVLRLIQLLGFVGDRQAGLDALELAREGPDLRAPLATLSLLWYHTIMNPLYAVEHSEITKGVSDATNIVNESKQEFSNSAIFFFFRGRIHRLKNEINDAVNIYASAVTISGQRELSLLCLHEVGWCRLMQLDFAGALHAFVQLKDQSRWSKMFYAYLAAVCWGSLNEMSHVVQLTQCLRRNPLNTKLSQLDFLIWQRTFHLMPTRTSHYYRLLVYEMLYLWNSMPNSDGLLSIVQDIEKNGRLTPGKLVLEPMTGLSALLAGVCLSNLGKEDDAVAMLTAVRVSRMEGERRFRSKSDIHISAYALYELAMICMKRKKYNEAKIILETTLAVYSNYDFEHRLRLKINSVLKYIDTK